MREIYDATLLLHVGGGAVGLLSLLAPLLATKGGALHRRVGWVFTIAMSIASMTGVLIGLSWVTIPARVKNVTDPAVLEQVRVLGLFFLLLSMMAAASLLRGIVIIRERRSPLPRARTAVRVLGSAVPILGAIVVVGGVSLGSLLLIGFGLLGVIGGILELRAKRDGPKAWLIGHLDAMLGAATVALTAFTVQMVGQSFALWAWSLPVAAGTIATLAWKRSILGRR